MGKINITEKDLSWYTRQGYGPLVIFVPGVSTNGPTDRPTLCSSITHFERVYGKPLVTSDGKDFSRSYNIAESFIKAGSSVLFMRFAGESPSAKNSTATVSEDGYISLVSKTPGEFLNGMTVTSATGKDSKSASFVITTKDGQVLERIVANFSDMNSNNYYTNELSSYVNIVVSPEFTGLETSTLNPSSTFADGSSGFDTEDSIVNAIVKEGALSVLKDPYSFDFDIAVSSGFAINLGDRDEDLVVAPNKVDVAILDVVKSRGNAIYLIDGAPDATASEFYSYCCQAEFNSSYCAGIGPWCSARLLNNGVITLLPGSYSMIVAWAKSTSEGIPVWMAPAGVKRASLGSFFVKPQYEIGQAVLDSWQNDDEGSVDYCRVNPIMKAKNYGYVIFGNSTLLHSSSEGDTSMLQSLSTRVTINLIKKEAFNVALSLQFDQMSNDLVLQFKTLLSVLLDQMKYTGAVYDYRIVTDTPEISMGNLNERKLPVVIQISPSPAVEFFDISLEITKAGVTFSDDDINSEE